jgi:hypothetical protein
VVTVEEDNLLTAADAASRMPPSWIGDVWAGLRGAGQEPGAFAPIALGSSS